MVKYSNSNLDQVFAALSDPTRRAIVSRLAEGQATASQLAEPFGMSLPAVSKHLRVLETATLIQRDIRGRHHHFTLNTGPMKEAQDWIDHYRSFWESSLDKLADYLETTKKENKHGHRNKTRKSKS